MQIPRGEPHRHTWRQFNNSNISLTDRKGQLSEIRTRNALSQVDSSYHHVVEMSGDTEAKLESTGMVAHRGRWIATTRYFCLGRPLITRKWKYFSPCKPQGHLTRWIYGDNHLGQLQGNGNWFWLLPINGGDFVHLSGQECGHIIFSSNAFSIG